MSPPVPPPGSGPLHLDRIRRALRGCPVGHTVRYHGQVTSTMSAAQALAVSAADPGDRAGWVVVAEEQTAGRGRLGRGWEAPRERAILFSVIVAGSLLPPLPEQLPLIGGLAVVRTLRGAYPELAPALGLKWPNDVVWRGPGRGWHKLAGVLVESAGDGERIRHAVLGIGLNVHQAPHELPQPRPGGLPPTSLALVLAGTGPGDRTELFIRLCRELGRLLAPATRPDPQALHREWHAALIHLGRPVQVDRPGGSSGSSLRGRAVDTTLSGGLVVLAPDGEPLVVHAGEVQVDWEVLRHLV